MGSVDLGPITVLATGLAFPFAVVVDATHVYFTARGTLASGFMDGTVQRVPDPTLIALVARLAGIPVDPPQGSPSDHSQTLGLMVVATDPVVILRIADVVDVVALAVRGYRRQLPARAEVAAGLPCLLELQPVAMRLRRAALIDGHRRAFSRMIKLVQITVLGSGSQGNAALVQAGETAVLIDAGVALPELRQRLAAGLGAVPEHLAGVLVTHAHRDHGAHAAACAEAFEAPVLATGPTLRRLAIPASVSTVEVGSRACFEIGELQIRTLPVPHDLPQVALVLEHHGTRAGMATDLGRAYGDLVRHLAGCGTVLIESNYEPILLASGDYPDSLKRRISSSAGHLSNERCAVFLSRLGPELETVVLLHLSQENNEPELARASAERALERRRGSVRLEVALPDQPLTVHVRPAARQLELPLS